MADFEKHGDGSYKWAFEDATAPSIPGMKITELNIEGEPEFMATGEGTEGMVEAVVKSPTGQDKKTFTASGFLLDADDFDSEASTFMFRGRYFIITKKGEKYNHKDMQKCDFSGISYYKVTGPAN